MDNKRRKFLLSSFILSTFAVGTSVISTSASNSFLNPNLKLNERSSNSKFVLNDIQKLNLLKLQNILFPANGLAPSIAELKADKYLQKVLLDTDYDLDIRQLLYDGIKHISDDNINKMSDKNAEDYIGKINDDWAENFLAMILLFIFEAMFSDPIYGHNLNNIGYDWINHIPGLPSANNHNKYKALAD